MKTIKTNIKDCLLISPRIFKDERGYFFESFNKRNFLQETGLDIEFVQDNESMSNYGVIRGLHAQAGEHAQAKLIKVTKGKVLDVVLDARKDSPSFGKIYTAELSAANKHQLFVPRGCLHGFSVMADNTIFTYKCDNYYHKESEIGVYPLDEALEIDWKIEKGNKIISEKDRAQMSWDAFVSGL